MGSGSGNLRRARARHRPRHIRGDVAGYPGLDHAALFLFRLHHWLHATESGRVAGDSRPVGLSGRRARLRRCRRRQWRGQALISKLIAAYPLAKGAVPELRMVVVTGPRIDPAQFPQYAGLELHSYVHRLYAHLCVCDLAVVQGGLTTTMELTAAKRPFLYFPLAHHFEQNFHVRHRLDRYRAGECMDYSTSDPDLVAARIAQLIGKRVDYVDVETDGAARAAQLIAELI
jgi:hypothetical protein